MKFYLTKTWTNETEFQPTINRADRNENQEPDRLAVGHFEATRNEIKGVASTAFCLFQTVFFETSGKVVGDAEISLTFFTF